MINSIEFLKSEHRNVERILQIIKSMSIRVLNNTLEDYNDFYDIIDCIKNYADKIHHKKEEDMLFKVMIEELPDAIRKTIQYGMLVEHDMGRLFNSELEAAVKSYEKGNDDQRAYIISNALSYVSLLERHINKEDKIIFNFAKNNLSQESLEKLNKEFEKHIELENSKYYIGKIEFLEKKYL